MIIKLYIIKIKAYYKHEMSFNVTKSNVVKCNLMFFVIVLNTPCSNETICILFN